MLSALMLCTYKAQIANMKYIIVKIFLDLRNCPALHFDMHFKL